MQTNQKVRCPNCGSDAWRNYFTSDDFSHRICPSNQVIQTECPACDYLMIMCSRNARVVEAYAPGIMSSQKNKSLNSPQSLAITIPINLSILSVIDR
jgi:hypothetical protein